VDLRIFIHLGTCNSSHLKAISHLPGPKKYLENGESWYWLWWTVAENRKCSENLSILE